MGSRLLCFIRRVDVKLLTSFQARDFRDFKQKFNFCERTSPVLRSFSSAKRPVPKTKRVASAKKRLQVPPNELESEKQDLPVLENVNPSVHGNWTVENAKNKLHQFLDINGLKNDYKYESSGPPHSRSFRAEMTVFVKEKNRSITARASGPNKRTASKLCALSLVRQLYHLGVVESFEGTLKAKRSERKKHQIEPFPVALPEDMVARIERCLESLAIAPKQLPSESSEPIDLLLPEAEAETSEAENSTNNQSSSVIPWSPPSQGWNPWTGSSIEKGHLAKTSLEELSQKLLRRERDKQEDDWRYQERTEARQALPISALRNEILEKVHGNSVVLIRGGTGCGKTTQIAQFILEDFVARGKGAFCNICVTQPRRISAISVAERVAFERNERLGESVGYNVRFESVFPRPYGSVLFCTVGVLLRKLESGLRGVSHVIVDEIHERDLNSDFLLVILRDMVEAYPDLRVVLMSATIDTTLFSRYFQDCPVIEVPGRTFPVQHHFLEDAVELTKFEYAKSQETYKISGVKEESEKSLNSKVDPKKYAKKTLEVVGQMPESEINFELIEKLLLHVRSLPSKGAVLVFLPGWSAIFELMKHLQTSAEFSGRDCRILPLHSQIPIRDQKRVFEAVPEGVTKIVLATNIAETSITIDDVVFVIDACRTRVKQFSSRSNLTSYDIVWASRANLEQRKGRAGRVRPGVCFTLCSRARFAKLKEHMTPEIRRTPLYELALKIKLLRLGDIKEFLFKTIESPPLDAVIEAIVMLRDLQCLDKHDQLTPLGEIIARLPIEPRLGKMMVFGSIFGSANSLATVAAYSGDFSEVFVLDRETQRLTEAQRGLGWGRNSDHAAMLDAFTRWETAQGRGEEAERSLCQSLGLQQAKFRLMQKVKEQILGVLRETGFPEDVMAQEDSSLDVALALLTVGLYPNVCYHIGKRKILTSGGSEAQIHKTSINCDSPASFRYPFFLFAEKSRMGSVSCRQLSMVSPLSLLLFGARKVELVEELVRIDDWINLEMDSRHAAAVCALRQVLGSVLGDVSRNPKGVLEIHEGYREALDVIRDLCKYDTLKVEGDVK